MSAARLTAVDAVVRFFLDVDRRDWPAIRAGLAGTVRSDYTSLFEGTVEELAGEELVGRWEALLPGFDGTQHFLGALVAATDPPADVAAGGVWLECNVRGYHRLDDREWLVAGRYRLRVDADARISAITLDTTYQSGDTSLPAEASRRAASRT